MKEMQEKGKVNMFSDIDEEVKKVRDLERDTLWRKNIDFEKNQNFRYRSRRRRLPTGEFRGAAHHSRNSNVTIFQRPFAALVVPFQ